MIPEWNAVPKHYSSELDGGSGELGGVSSELDGGSSALDGGSSALVGGSWGETFREKLMK